MCSFFWREMENIDQGELADIVRGGGSGGSLSSPSTVDWQFHLEPTNNPPLGVDQLLDDFGDPFSSLSNPLLHELDMASGAATSFEGWNSAMGLVKMSVGGDGSGGSSSLAQQMLVDETKRSSNIFSRMLQINPTTKMAVPPRDNSAMVAAPSRGIKPSPLDANGMVKSNTSMNSSVENRAVQISTSRNPGIKRRKSQAKQVVCIPAPTPANNRSSGEVVPSDLWAWRKYGQKPIKGSPYPRGYYRCSSSKGCSARKQVERSRNDPNMLVITYTFEHNHPWPTQRNALAGSTRSQPIKNSSSTKSLSSTQTSKSAALKENGAENSSSTVTVVGTTTSGGAIKEEMGETEKEILVDTKDHQYDQPFNHSCRPLMLDSNQSDDSLFADLGELDPDPLNLMFSPGFSTAEKSNEDKVDKALDPFNLFEW